MPHCEALLYSLPVQPAQRASHTQVERMRPCCTGTCFLHLTLVLLLTPRRRLQHAAMTSAVMAALCASPTWDARSVVRWLPSATVLQMATPVTGAADRTPKMCCVVVTWCVCLQAPNSHEPHPASPTGYMCSDSGAEEDASMEVLTIDFVSQVWLPLPILEAAQAKLVFLVLPASLCASSGCHTTVVVDNA